MKRARETKAERRRSGVGSGCLGLVLEITVWVLSTLLITLGVFLLLFGVLDFTPESRTKTIVVVIIAPVAVFFFVRTGRAILDDLRRK